MINNYEHYISKNIKAFYRKRLFSPLIYLLVLALLWVLFSLGSILSPRTLSKDEKLGDSYSRASTYVRGTFTDLTFSGYTHKNWLNKTTGYYYYGIRQEQCYLLLLSPDSCEEGIPQIDKITVRCQIIHGKQSYSKILSNLANDLNWTEEGIHKQMPAYFYSEPDYHWNAVFCFFIFYFGSMGYAVLCLILYLIYIAFPFLSPPCLDLAVFGRPRALLDQAEEELATLPQLATEDMFITEHFFIVTSPYGNAIVPINEILWIYKHSTLHKFLWYHFSISYTLHITANNHFYIRCPKNIKSDIDGIMDYLAEANHDILVGFSEENRITVQKNMGNPFHVEKLVALLRRKV